MDGAFAPTGNGLAALNSTVSDAPGGKLPSPALIYLFNVFTFLGLFSLLALLITAWKVSHIRRSITWYAFIISWMAFCVVNFMLLGHQFENRPGFGLCLIQAAFTYAMPALTAYSTLAMMLQLLLSAAALVRDGSNVEGKILYLLLTLPSGIAALVFIEALIYGIERNDSIARSNSGMLCRITDGTPVKVSAGLVIVAMLALLIVEAFTFLFLYRNWTAFRKLKRSQIQKSGVSLFTIIRVSVFGMLPMLALGLSFQASLQKNVDNSLANAQANILTESLPFAAGLIFGTHRDMLDTWTSWCRKKKYTPEPRSTAVQNSTSAPQYASKSDVSKV